jgi:diguanylate cyclase (GGDEF)-like protein
MEPGPDHRETLSAPEDALLGLRGRITARTGVIASILIAPFCVFHLMQGRVVLAALDFFAALIFGGNAVMLITRQRPLLPYPLLVAVLSLAVLGSVHMVGGPALHWAFPALLFFYMVLPRRQAHLACAVLLCGALALAQGQIDTASSLRFVVTSGLTLLLLNVVLAVLGELQQRLILQSLTDPLTGALNRRSLGEALGTLTVGQQASQAVLVSFDVDHFKAINDQLGHGVGDQVLRQMVKVARTRLRASDRLYRMGGEEFVLVLKDISLDDAQRVAEDLRQRIADAALLPSRPVTVSVGVSPWRRGFDADRWLSAVDAAMYEAKRLGRNRVVMA